MPKSSYRAAPLGGTADEVEAAFYEALRHGDIEQLMACWADEDDVVCVHPNAPRLVGVVAIRASFEAMFARGTLQIVPERVRRIDTLGAAVHSVLERVDEAADAREQVWVVATNVFLKTAQGWRMVAHHASAGRSEVAEVTVPGQLLH